MCGQQLPWECGVRPVLSDSQTLATCPSPPPIVCSPRLCTPGTPPGSHPSWACLAFCQEAGSPVVVDRSPGGILWQILDTPLCGSGRHGHPPLQCFVTRTGSVARFLPGVIFHPVLSDIQRARQIILFLLRLCDFRAVSCFLNHIS